MKLELLALLVVLGAAGCVDVNRTLIKSEDNVIGRAPETVVSPRFTADTRMEGPFLKVLVTAQCDEVERQTVERIDHYEKTLRGEDIAWNTALSLLGAGPMAAGTALVADAPNVHDSDMNGRLYNEVGQEAAIGVGTALLGLGLACALPPLVNGLRSVGSSEERTTATRVGPTLRERVMCPGALPLPPYAVTARFSNGQTVGISNAAAGVELSVDLRTQLGPTLLGMSPPPPSVAIWINGKFQTEIATADILQGAKVARDASDDQTWLQAEPEACRVVSSSCAKVQAYLSAFPNGLHAAEARKLLAPRSNVVATDPTDLGGDPAVDAAVKAATDARAGTEQRAAERAAEDERKAKKKAQQESKKACEQSCAESCKGNTKCRDACILKACP